MLKIGYLWIVVKILYFVRADIRLNDAKDKLVLLDLTNFTLACNKQKLRLNDAKDKIVLLDLTNFTLACDRQKLHFNKDR